MRWSSSLNVSSSFLIARFGRRYHLKIVVLFVYRTLLYGLDNPVRVRPSSQVPISIIIVDPTIMVKPLCMPLFLVAPNQDKLFIFYCERKTTIQSKSWCSITRSQFLSMSRIKLRKSDSKRTIGEKTNASDYKGSESHRRVITQIMAIHYYYCLLCNALTSPGAEGLPSSSSSRRRPICQRGSTASETNLAIKNIGTYWVRRLNANCE